MLINKKILAILISVMMTASLFMTQMLAADMDTVSGNEGGSVEEVQSVEAPETVENAEPSAEDEPAPAVSSNEGSSKKSNEGEDEGDREPDAASDGAGSEESGNTGSDAETAESGEGHDYMEGEASGKSEDTALADAEAAGETESTEGEKAETEKAETEASSDKWLEEHGVTENDDGKLEYTDENGDTWEFEKEDPEMFRHIGGDEEYDHQTEISLSRRDIARRAALGEEQDPYTLILNPDFRYRYPDCFSGGEEEVLPDVRLGMDISRYQGVISVDDWRTLKDEYGIEFVFIRAGYRGYGDGGSMNEDECCAGNIENAHEAGVAVGIYYFSQAISEEEAVAEAEHCLEIIGDHRDMIDLPVVTDYEYSGAPGRLRGADLSDGEHTAIVNAFCDRVEEEGYIPGIYANKSMLQQDMILNDIPEEHHIWMANFVCDSGAGTYSTSYEGALSAWQFSSRFTGFGEGRNGLGLMKSANLDLDLWYGAFPGEDEADREVVEEQTVKIVDADNDEAQEITVTVNTGDEEQEETEDDTVSIRNATMTAEDVVYQPRPRICRTSVRVYDSDGSRLAAGFDYDRELSYTYDDDITIQRRVDMWAREYETVDVNAGDPVDLKRDIIPVGAVIRVTVTGKGRYKDADDDKNKLSTTFRFIPDENREEPVEIEAITEERPSGKHKRLISRLKASE